MYIKQIIESNNIKGINQYTYATILYIFLGSTLFFSEDTSFLI